ncbi:sugar ABC transporter permease [Labrys miyagiensis]
MSANADSLGDGFNARPSSHFAARAGRNFAAASLRAGSYLAFAAILAFFAWHVPFFLSIGNVGGVLGQSAILGVLAIGMTVVVIGGGSNVVTGGIDLSLAANMGLSAAIYATLIAAGFPDWTAAGGALVTGVAIGLVNAVAVTRLHIVPLLATLAVMNIVAGLELVVTQNTVVPASTDFLSLLSGYGPLSIPILAFVLVAFTLVAIVIVQYTPLGLRLYAVGEFPEAARASGLSVDRVVAGTYVASGLCGGIAGILSVAYLSGSTTGSGDMLLPVVVTALLGVVFSRRLVPTIGGAFLSTLFVGFLINGFQLLNVSSYWVSGVQGVLILAVVAATSILRREGTRP